MEFGAYLLSSVVQRGWQVATVLVVLVVVELLASRGPVPLVSRLRATAIWMITIPATALCLAAFHFLWWRSGLSPLVRLPLGDWLKPLGVIGLVLAPVLAGVIADFFGYWYHRAQHAIPFLWRIHAVHHSIRDLNAVNSNHHWTEEVFRVPLMTLPAALLIGPNPGPTLPVIAAILALQGAFIHAATRLHIGPLRWVFVDNAYHRLHHSTEERHFGKNFAAFTPLWDFMFGTALLPTRGEWPETGLADQQEPATVRGFILAPLVRTVRKG